MSCALDLFYCALGLALPTFVDLGRIAGTRPEAFSDAGFDVSAVVLYLVANIKYSICIVSIEKIHVIPEKIIKLEVFALVTESWGITPPGHGNSM